MASLTLMERETGIKRSTNGARTCEFTGRINRTLRREESERTRHLIEELTVSLFRSAAA
jgi:hypothetical protein